jgi:hypothetical protein
MLPAVVAFGVIGCGRTSLDEQQFAFTKMVGGQRLTQISAGDTHTCAIADTRTASCCGDNFWGMLGDGTVDERDVLTPVKF